MENIPDMKEKKKGFVLCFGDSNTWGYDPRSYLGGQYSKDVRWTGILNQETEWNIFNHGQNGREIPHDDSRIQSAVSVLLGESRRLISEVLAEPSLPADQEDAYTCPVWIWIMLGSNDLLMNHFFKAEDVVVRMEHFLTQLLQAEQLQRQSEPIHIRLIAPPAMQRGTWVEEERLLTESRRLGALESELAEQFHIAYTDTSGINIPITFDGVHLSPEGHRVFADKMKKCL